jgi:hypothetical protein
MNRVIPSIIVLWIAVAYSGLGFAEPPTTKSDVNPFEFTVHRGDSIFFAKMVDLPAGDKKEAQGDQYQELFKGFVSSDAATDKWRVRIVLADDPDKGTTRMKLTITLSTNNGENGSMYTRMTRAWFVTDLIGENHPGKNRILELAETRPQGEEKHEFEYHRFLFAFVDGKPQYLVLAIGNRKLFPNVISVPKNQFNETWNQTWAQLNQETPK